MNISMAARQSGLTAKTIRYYEDIGLVVPARLENGYRDYGESDVHRLRFIHRARDLGFDIDSCRKLLDLYADRSRASSNVKTLAEEHLAEIDRKIAELQAMARTLRELVRDCRGDNRPDCPIIEELSGDKPAGTTCRH